MFEDAAVYLFWETPEGGCQVRTQAVDYSSRGLRFRTNGKLPAGKILWCALPSQGLYSRARVCHTTGRFWGRMTGVQLLANPLPADGAAYSTPATRAPQTGHRPERSPLNTTSKPERRITAA